MKAFPSYVDIEFTARCNLNCGFCFGPADDRDVPDLSFVFWRNVISAVRNRGCNGVVVSGGEPTLYPYLRELLEHAQKIGLQTVLSTHGRHEERLLSVVNWCDWVALPVDAVSHSSLRAMRGGTWGLGSAVALAGRMKAQTEGRIKMKLGTVATKMNLNEVIDLASELADLEYLPFDTWKIYQYTPRRKFAGQRSLYEISAEGFHEMSQRVLVTGVGTRLNTVFSTQNLRRNAYLFVYPDGTVAIPNNGESFSDIVLGNIAREGETALDRVLEYDLFSNCRNYETTYV